MKDRQSKIRPIKTGCKDYTQNFRPEKFHREKSHCVVCMLNKSRVLKQKDSNNKK